MSPKQIKQFNAMRAALIKIGKGYQTPQQIHKTSKKTYGLDPEEVLQMAYENMQNDANIAVSGVKAIDLKAQEVAS